jgi:hypothetical protein
MFESESECAGVAIERMAFTRRSEQVGIRNHDDNDIVLAA